MTRLVQGQLGLALRGRTLAELAVCTNDVPAGDRSQVVRVSGAACIARGLALLQVQRLNRRVEACHQPGPADRTTKPAITRSSTPLHFSFGNAECGSHHATFAMLTVVAPSVGTATEVRRSPLPRLLPQRQHRRQHAP